jgi:hypothetical protein
MEPYIVVQFMTSLQYELKKLNFASTWCLLNIIKQKLLIRDKIFFIFMQLIYQ